MKRLLLFCFAAALTVVPFAFAQKPVEEKKIKCPVMTSVKVLPSSAVKKKLYSDYKGRRYVFCCKSCKPLFDKNPAQFAKSAESIPIPKKTDE